VMGLVKGTDGTRTATYEYDPFGQPLRATGAMALANPMRFSTKFTDNETGLLYYGYRYYVPPSGRWLNRDPIGERGGLNVYGLTRNCPITRTDGLGLQHENEPPLHTSGYKNQYFYLNTFIVDIVGSQEPAAYTPNGGTILGAAGGSHSISATVVKESECCRKVSPRSRLRVDFWWLNGSRSAFSHELTHAGIHQAVFASIADRAYSYANTCMTQANANCYAAAINAHFSVVSWAAANYWNWKWDHEEYGARPNSLGFNAAWVNRLTGAMEAALAACVALI